MGRWLVVAVVLLGCRKASRHPGGDPAGVTGAQAAGSGSVSVSVDAAVGEPEVATVFASFAELARAGRRAVGRRAELGLRRRQLRPDRVVAVSCSNERADVVDLGFSAAQRELVRALPRSAPGCAQVLLEVEEVEVLKRHGDDGGAGALAGPTLVKARALEFPGLAPVPALAAPAGADFGDFEEIVFAGPAAEGKVAELVAQLDDAIGVNLIPCGRDGKPQERELGDLVWLVRDGAREAAPTPHDDCRKVRFRIHPRQPSSGVSGFDPAFEAELLVGKDR